MDHTTCLRKISAHTVAVATTSGSITELCESIHFHSRTSSIHRHIWASVRQTTATSCVCCCTYRGEKAWTLKSNIGYQAISAKENHTHNNSFFHRRKVSKTLYKELQSFEQRDRLEFCRFEELCSLNTHSVSPPDDICTAFEELDADVDRFIFVNFLI